jgi:hypothetical protein
MWTYICYPHTRTGVDLCSTLGLKSVDGSTACPSAGTYTIDSSLSVPGDSSWIISAFEGWTFTITAVITDSAGSGTQTTCSAKVTTLSTSASSAYQMGFGAAALGLLIAFARSRRPIRTAGDASSSLMETQHSPEPGALEMPSTDGRSIV